jgi:hypothetical protein
MGLEPSRLEKSGGKATPLRLAGNLRRPATASMPRSFAPVNFSLDPR